MTRGRVAIVLPFAIILSAGSLLSGCGESESSPTGHQAGDPPGEGTNREPNGTLTVGGKAFPAFVSGLLADTSMTLSAQTWLSGTDTGWTILLTTRTAAGTHAHPANGSMNAFYSATPTDTGCIYTAISGSVTLDAWSPREESGVAKATFSGSASIGLAEWFQATGKCPDLSLSLVFHDAEGIEF